MFLNFVYIFFSCRFYSFYFTLQSDIEIAKQLPPNEINRIEYDLKHEVYENRLDQLEETVEIIFKLGIELDKELHILDADYNSNMDSKIKEIESKIKATNKKRKRK